MKLIILLAAIAISCQLKAQEENTRERLITQLKNGTAPGLQFAKNAPAAARVEENVETKESLISQIRKGTAARMKFMGAPAAGTTARAVTIPRPTAPAVALASEQPIKKDQLKVAVAPPIIPTQEVVTKEEGKQ